MTGVAIDSRSDRTARLLALSAAAVATVAIALYWPARGAGFVGDDFMILHRLRALASPADAARFFRGEFFEYYRPLGFVSHAIDWFTAGADAPRFHLTNILLHAANAVIVLLIGQALSPRSLAGQVAALLFALHAANHEAAVWISARFDLLATFFALLAVCWLVRRWPGERWAPALFLFPALLSKESSVAIPLAAAAWSAFVLEERTREAALRVSAWLGALAAYALLRRAAGGVSPFGGASKAPKLAVLAAGVVLLLVMSDGRWRHAQTWLRANKARSALIAGSVLVVLIAAAACHGRGSDLAREKLSVASFALFYLATPVLDAGAAFSDPSTSVYWIGGSAGLAILGVLVLIFWRPLLDDGRYWFLAAFLAATLLPISALTEGKRYLYLPSAASSVLVAIAVTERGHLARRTGIAIIAALLVVSAVQVEKKIRDWVWAGTMTAEAASLVDETLAPSCGTGHVVFLTSPVGLRGVYTQFYYETFEPPRGCMPAVFQTLVRLMRSDTVVKANWDGPLRIVITAPVYRDNFVISADLRNFDLPVRGTAPTALRTPLGELRAQRTGSTERLTLTLDPDVHPERIAFFYYTNSRIVALPHNP